MKRIIFIICLIACIGSAFAQKKHFDIDNLVTNSDFRISHLNYDSILGIKNPIETDFQIISENGILFLVREKFDSILEKKQLSTRTGDGFVDGESVYRNEFGINEGIFISPNKKFVAYYSKDERHIARYPLVEIANPKKSFLQNRSSFPNLALDEIRYPVAGSKNEIVNIGVYDIEKDKTIFLKVNSDEENYRTNVAWSPDSKFIYLVVLTRNQKNLSLRKYDVANGDEIAILFEEHHDKYIEPEHPPIFIPNKPDYFLWYSKKSAFQHLYLYKNDGSFVRKVTGNQTNNYNVQSIEAFDKKGNVYFMSNKKSPLESQFYSTNIFTKIEEKLLSPDEGNHYIVFNEENQHFIDIFSNKNETFIAKYFDNKGKSEVLKKAENAYNQYEMPEIEIGTIKAADGLTDLYYRLIKPLNFNEKEKYPVVIYVYGGPHTKLIENIPNWATDRFLLYLAQEGFVVWTVDNRGSSDRGLYFENAIYENLATVCVDDQIKGIDYLKSLNFIDKDRIGVYGWSFGGFLTVALKLKTDDVKVAVAGGPVINWEYYEIMYGERYMNTPENNPAGYAEANLLNYFEDLEGKLLIIHGAKDNTVLPLNSLSFVNKCVEKLIPIDFFIYPDDPHNVRAFKRNHLNRKIFEYFKQNL